MLDHKVSMLAIRHTELSWLWSVKPWSRNTSFMCWLIAPMAPIEQKLPMASSQKEDRPSRKPNSRGFCLVSGALTAAPSGCRPISEGRSLSTQIASGQARSSNSPMICRAAWKPSPSASGFTM